MLKEKMLWMKDSGNIGDEIRQCRDEGRQTGQGASVGNGELPC